MNKSLLFTWLFYCTLIGCKPADDRLAITSVIASENTGQDYSSWLTDDLKVLVPDCWDESNFKYVDVTFTLQSAARITRISLYDFQGKFDDNPAYIYSLYKGKKTLVGKFTGDQYNTFVDIILGGKIVSDALIIHKYSNNVPQKIKIFGYLDPGVVSASIRSPLYPAISFTNLLNKVETDSAFQLAARSTNTGTAITFGSSDTSVLQVQRDNNRWIASLRRKGVVAVTARQERSGNFLEGKAVKTIIVRGKETFRSYDTKIPIDSGRWFQLTNATSGLGPLFDGKTDKEINTGYGKLLENYDSYYPVYPGEQVDLTGARFYDGRGTAAGKPMKLSVITAEGQRITVGTFTGEKYNAWVGPDPETPDVYNFQTTFKDIKAIVINSWDFFPAEIEFFGNYVREPAGAPAPKMSYPLTQMFGVNGFEWDFEAPGDPGKIYNKRMQSNRVFTGLRHYMDWEKIEPAEGQFTFNPVREGGWNYDVLYDSCKAARIEVLACLKTIPPWIVNSYPASGRDRENVPARYGKNLLDVNSYIEQARAAFQFAARYGGNRSINPALVRVNSTPRWKGDKVNEVKTGLNLVRYIECENERDKWWKGRNAYQNAFEYAANLSAFYDGHKNSMGSAVGVKNADSSMKVVMGGTASASTDYLKGMVEWCRQNRGYNADGTVNLCWDVINYHYYSNNSGTSQTGRSERGAAPELSGAMQVAAEFISQSHAIANNLPVWITELGYDLNQGSPFKVPAIGSKNPSQVQADWIMRSSLLYAKAGVERIFFYQLQDDDPGNPLQFSTSGLLNEDMSLRPAATLLSQINRHFGNYSFDRTLVDSPVVDRYVSAGNTLYVLYFPSEEGRTGSTLLDTGEFCDSAVIFIPRANRATMDSVIRPVVNGKLRVQVSETPVFVRLLKNQTELITGQRSVRIRSKRLAKKQ